jgi:hypothetical protein
MTSRNMPPAYVDPAARPCLKADGLLPRKDVDVESRKNFSRVASSSTLGADPAVDAGCPGLLWVRINVLKGNSHV